MVERAGLGVGSSGGAEDENGFPYVLEAAFASGALDTRETISGCNFSTAIGNPFRSFNYEFEGLESLLAEQRPERADSPSALASVPTR